MYDILQLNEMLVPELREIAEQLNLKSYKRLSKQDLIYKILDEQALSGDKKTEDTKETVAETPKEDKKPKQNGQRRQRTRRPRNQNKEQQNKEQQSKEEPQSKEPQKKEQQPEEKKPDQVKETPRDQKRTQSLRKKKLHLKNMINQDILQGLNPESQSSILTWMESLRVKGSLK